MGAFGSMSEFDGDGAPGGCARPATGIGAVCVLAPPALSRIDTLDVSGRPPSEPESQRAVARPSFTVAGPLSMTSPVSLSTTS